MKNLQDHLCLTRPNFQINPKQSLEDAKLYFGKGENNELIRRITTGYLAGYVPRIYLFGNYGTGKTHLLYHLKHHFNEDQGSSRVLPLVVQVEAESRSRYQVLHRRLLDAIGIDRLEKAYLDYGFQSGADREARFREIFSNSDVYRVMQLLPMGPANRTLAWRWLAGDKLSTGEMAQLGVTGGMAETADLVELIVCLGELFKRLGQNLLFLVDEGEALHNVQNLDAQRSWHDAFRRLSDANDNQSVGWILTFYATIHEEAPEFMREGDITTRLGQDGIRTLDPLKKVEVREFLNDLLRTFVDQKSAAALIQSEKIDAKPSEYPFTRDGMLAFVEHAAAAEELAIPRTILRAITACALEALSSGSRQFDASLVHKVVPPEFTQMA